jgi:type IV secretory pathway VirB10-like protein
MAIRAFVVVLPMLIFTLTGCSAPPTAEADAARESIASASSAGADKYAPASLQEAQTAQAALDAELKAQEGKYVKSYDRARELAVAAKTAADKAATDARTERERVEADEARKAKAAAARREARQGDSRRRQRSSADQDQGGRSDLPGHRAVRPRHRRRRDRSDD